MYIVRHLFVEMIQNTLVLSNCFFMQFMRLYKLLSHVPFQKKEQKVFSSAVPTIILLFIERICLGLELKTLLLLECDSHSFIHWDC